MSRRLFPRRSAYRALALTLAILASPAFLYVGWQLFSGGQMRHIALRHLLWPIAAALVGAGFALAATVASRLARAFPGMSRARAAGTIAGLAVSAFVVNQVDRTVYPRLYGYLHGALATVTVLLSAFAIGLVRLRSGP